MGFKAIGLDKYIKLHLKSNPKEKEQEVRAAIKSSLKDYKNGVLCNCGNEIWVIGSAFVGNSCFTCITGETNPTDDFELDEALNTNKKRL